MSVFQCELFLWTLLIWCLFWDKQWIYHRCIYSTKKVEQFICEVREDRVHFTTIRITMTPATTKTYQPPPQLPHNHHNSNVTVIIVVTSYNQQNRITAASVYQHYNHIIDYCMMLCYITHRQHWFNIVDETKKFLTSRACSKYWSDSCSTTNGYKCNDILRNKLYNSNHNSYNT